MVTVPEISYQTFREAALARQVDAEISRKLDFPKPPPEPPKPRPYVRKRRDPRGSKPGVKRGHYKKQINPEWKNAPYVVEFKMTKPVHIGPPPKKKPGQLTRLKSSKYYQELPDPNPLRFECNEPT